jgi:hypothetical protein
MRLPNRFLVLIVSLLATVGLMAWGTGGSAVASQNVPHATPQANCPPNCPKATWKIVRVGAGYDTYGSWHDCAKVTPTSGFNKSYTCSFTGGVSNGYSETIGISVEGISASVGYSVTYSTSITGGTTYTPINQKKTRGEVQWTSEYITRPLYEELFLEGIVLAKHTGYAHRWDQPVSRFVPAGTTTTSTSGKFTHKHWKCKKTCP